MKIARSLSAVLAAAVALQGNAAWAQALIAGGLGDSLPDPVPSTGTARLTSLDGETLGVIPAASTASAAEVVKAPPPPTGLNALVEGLNSEPIDFNFKETDLLGILRSFAARFNKNIIAAPGVGGKVNMQLKGVPFDQAFRVLLESMGLVAIQRGDNVIEVIKAANMPVLSQVFPLKYRFAADLQPMLTNSLDKEERTAGAFVTMDNASNSIVATAQNDTLQKIRQLIASVDVPSPQIAIKARLIEVETTNDLNWGINWAGSTQFGSGGRVRSIKDQSNYAVLPDGSIAVGGAVTNFPSGGILDISSIMNKTQVYAMLNFIKSDTRSKTLSEPMVLTGSNKVAKIHVGKNIPVVTSQVTQTATTQSVTYLPEGVDLEVTPVVSPGSSTISFKVRINVSELVGFQLNNPITTERVAQTEVAVESGMTVVIGGLIKDTLVDTDSGIPILKDIPLLGWFFKNKTKNKDRTELLIFITPELQATKI
ncbi:MAG TPA: secretin N-terminal domain-containing protein [Elusimicrobiota bacterium]|nr:secretin N-terminal domain-containing protein [Elusimicrobiota bacterium]